MSPLDTCQLSGGPVIPNSAVRPPRPRCNINDCFYPKERQRGERQRKQLTNYQLTFLPSFLPRRRLLKHHGLAVSPTSSPLLAAAAASSAASMSPSASLEMILALERAKMMQQQQQQPQSAAAAALKAFTDRQQGKSDDEISAQVMPLILSLSCSCPPEVVVQGDLGVHPSFVSPTPSCHSPKLKEQPTNELRSANFFVRNLRQREQHQQLNPQFRNRPSSTDCLPA